MKQLKKTLLTLVALLAVTTGAWATEFTSLKVGDVLHVGDAINTGTNYKVYGLYLDAGYQPATLVRANIGTNDITESETGAYYLIKGKNDFYFGIIWGAEGLEGGYWPVTDTSDGISVTAITPGDYTELTFAVHEGTATPVDIAWNAESKTGTFKQPAGNVTVSVEYYPQATLAFKGLTAAEDAAAKTEAPLAVVADGAVTGGTLMYYVATDKNFSQADAIALAETQWSAAIPTAETIEAAGTCYVWYYIKGDAEHSDTDPVPLAVTLLPEPTYAVTFADDTAEPTLWTADPNAGVKKGQTVTVTYTGTKKVIGVKAEKKAAAADVKITSFSLQGPSSLEQSDYANISIVNIVPSNATNQTFTWSTSGDISIFEVSNDTKRCVVKSRESVGNASVTATANDGSGVSYKINITITGDN